MLLKMISIISWCKKLLPTPVFHLPLNEGRSISLLSIYIADSGIPLSTRWKMQCLSVDANVMFIVLIAKLLTDATIAHAVYATVLTLLFLATS